MIRIAEGPQRLRLTGDDKDLRAVAQKMRYRPKGFEHSPKFKAYIITDGADGWDGYISPIFIRNPGTGSCLRGHKDTLIDTARRLDIPLDLSECIKSPFSAITSDDLPDDLVVADFQLDEYQRESVSFWLKHGMGVNKIAVNGGKTAMFAAAAAMIKRRYTDARALYVTQSERLVRQAYKDIKGFLPGWDISQYGGSRKDNAGKDMVIATVAMLWANRSDLAKEHWFDSFMALLYDESHHVCSPTSSKLMLQLPAYFRLGASDTRRENDPGKMAQIRGLLGPIRYTVPVSTYIDMGRTATPTIYIVENPVWRNRYEHLPHLAAPGTTAWSLIGDQWTKGEYVGPVYQRDDQGEIIMQKKRELIGTDEKVTYDAENRRHTEKVALWEDVMVPVTADGFHTIKFENQEQLHEVDSTYCLLQRVMDKAIVTFKERNALITAWARYYSRNCGYPTVVVCTRTLHVLILQEMIRKEIGDEKVQILFSDHSSKQRDTAFDWFRSTRGSVLITPLIKEGVSINEIRGGIIADYVGDWEVANQIIGRFIRKKKGENEAHITWFFDNQHPSLRRGSRRVLNKLSDIRRYRFCHPVLDPGSIGSAKVYEKLGD